jgi:hypothetical protein
MLAYRNLTELEGLEQLLTIRAATRQQAMVSKLDSTF